MKHVATICLFVFFGWIPEVLAQDSRDAVAVDPDHHQVLFENDYVRVFEALASPGAASPMHTHPPMVLVSLGKARLRMKMGDGSTTIFDLNPAQALWLQDVDHSWEMLAGQVHVIAVEIKGAPETAVAEGADAGARDAVAVDPDHHHVILENDYVRVFEVLAAPGAKSAMHTHTPLVVISLSKVRLRFGAGDGSTMIFDLNPGEAQWFQGIEHSWEALAGQVHVIAVEPKRAWAAAGE